MKDSIVKLLKERYFLPEESTWEDIVDRVSSIYPEIKRFMLTMDFIPSSPTLMNGGTKKRIGTLSSCFPMDIEDSIEGIYDALKECAITTKFGGGVGYDFSNLRSSKEGIKGLNGRKSSGPIPFIQNFNTCLDSIQQGGVRRGAGMGLLDITHGDIIEFIKAKEDTTKINRLNLSIKIGNDFYEKLEKTPDAVHQTITKEGEVVDLEWDGKKVTVKEVWNLIVKHAWMTAEPGIFNKDIAFNQCTTTNVSKTVISNPCLRDSVYLLTWTGLKQLKDINIGDTTWSEKGWTTVVNKWKTGTKEVYNYFTTGGTFESTENHEIVSEGKKIKVSEAKSIDTLLGIYSKPDYYDYKIIMDGLVLGDGSVHKASDNLIYLNIGEKDYDYFTSEISHLILRDRTVAFKNGWEVNTSLTYDEVCKTYDRKIPERFFSGYDSEVAFSFLRGLYSANGSICGGRVTYKSASFEMIGGIQLLLSSVGIRSYYTINKAKKILFSNGEYTCKQSYDLNITTDINKFYESIGFIQKYKMDKVKSLLNKRVVKPKVTFDIYKKELVGTFDVWDITVDNDTHTFWCNGFNISNCAEFTNIPYSSCNLGSINLSNIVANKKLDWEKFEELIVHATKFLNNVIDVNKFPIKKIEEVTKKVRPIGLGVMGFAHMLYKKRIPYNSDEAYKLADDIFKYMTLRSMKESAELAKKDGAYPAFDYELFMKANKRFFTKKKHKNIDIEELVEMIKKSGTRDSAFTSIAPTGSISFLADSSGGIEPVFALTYSRKIEKLNKEYETVFISDPVFEEYLNENFNEEEKIKILKHVADNKGSCQKCELIPEEDRKVFVVAGDISPIDHVKMLGAVSRNTSMSVSKTCNMPPTATEEEISELYLQAYKEGIIGVTIYRDGCREGILVHAIVDNKPAIVKTNAPKRPRSLPCHVYKIVTANKETKEAEKWIVFVGLLEGEPYEIIAGKIDLVDIPSSITDGVITKIKKGVYQFEVEDEVIIKDITKAFLNDIQEHTTRLMSWGLRHGGGINFLKDVLEKSKGSLVDFNKAIIRAINKYVKDITLKEKCPTCDSELIYVEGCIKCSSPECGWSRCS